MRPLAELLPHRPPWALVDRVLSVDGARVTAEKRVSAGDPLVAGGELAGPLLIEALAQAAACLMGLNRPSGSGHHGYLVAAQGWKFPSPARVGDTLTLRAEQTAAFGALYRFRAAAFVGEREVASGELTFAVRFDGDAAAGS